MSKIEVNTVDAQCGSTITIGSAGKTVNVPGTALTSTLVKSNDYQASDGGNIVSQCGTDITLGASGDTVTLASGATQSGFGRTGSVNWDTTPKTATFSAVSGNGYFCNTTSTAFTCNLPAGTAGDIVSVSDYANTWDSNGLTLAADGSELINGGSFPAVLVTAGLSVTLVYVDGTRGWKNIDDASTNVTGISNYIVACGGNTTITSGDYKIHVFTGPGTLAVTAAGNACGSNVADYLVVAGGGGGGGYFGGGGGAGGMRTFMPASTPMTAPAGLALPATPYPITVGGGGAGSAGSGAGGSDGNNSIFSTITSTAGGGGGGYPVNGRDGGSGGGGGSGAGDTAGSGNTPSVSPVQGKDGGLGYTPNLSAGGAGGANACGGAAPSGAGGIGGDGGYIPDTMLGPTAPSYGDAGPVPSTRYFAGGAGGGAWVCQGRPGGVGGAGGGGDSGLAVQGAAGAAGTTNTGGGGGGGNCGGAPGLGLGGLGGSGVVMIRYKFQN